MAKDVLSVEVIPTSPRGAESNIAGDPITLDPPIVLEERRQKGTNWFVTIVLFSLINSVITLNGSGLAFIIGLGITQLIDGIALYLIADGGSDAALGIKILAFIFDAAMIAVFGFFAFLARRRNRWAYAGGMAIYVADALLLLLLQSWLSVAFHLYALWHLWRGFQATQLLHKLEQAGHLSMPFKQLEAAAVANTKQRNAVNWKLIGKIAIAGVIIVILVSFVGRIFLEDYAASMP